MSAFILLVSGPSGAGKSTLLKKLFDEFQEELYFSISSTKAALKGMNMNINISISFNEDKN